MLSHYLLFTLQRFKQRPGFSAIKILSLTLGLWCSILVIMHVQYVYSFDKHFPGWEYTYRLVTSLNADGQQLDTPVSSDTNAAQMALDYPQIQYIARTVQGTARFARDNSMSSTNAYTWVEPDFLRIFDLEFLSGDAATALEQPYSAVLSETTARKYFGGNDPLGKTLTMQNRAEFKITGVIRDLPKNSSFQVDILLPAEAARQLFGVLSGSSWVAFGNTITYLRIPDPADASYISGDLPAFVQRNVPEQQKLFAGQRQLALYLEPLADIYLSPRQGFSAAGNPRVPVLIGLGTFAALIMLGSCINFANLSLSQIQDRAKEIGIRKTFGANHEQVISQFLFESLSLTLIALLIALPLIAISIPPYTALTGTSFTLMTALQNGLAWVLPALALVTGILSGIMPAFALSWFAPAAMTKGNSRVGFGAALSLATVVQFGFAISLIILAFAIKLQTDHLNNMDVGFNKENLIVMDSTYDARYPEIFNYDSLIEQLRQHPGILSIGRTSTPPPNTGNANAWTRSDNSDSRRTFNHFIVSDQYFDAMEFKLLAGRTFQQIFPTDYLPTSTGALPQAQDATATHSVVITRRGAESFGFESPEAALNQTLQLLNGEPLSLYRVIGVIEDFHLSGGLEDPQRSTSILRVTQDPLRTLLIRVDPAQLQSALDHIDTIWSRHRPNVPVSRTLYDQTFNDMVFVETDGISKAAIFASVITILISTAGLYALASHSTIRRVKEAGVRKVLGATVKSLIMLFTWNFIKPVILACVCAWAVSYHAVQYFLEQFSARTEISPLIYLLVALNTIFIAVLTVSFHCYKAASRRPVEALRYE